MAYERPEFLKESVVGDTRLEGRIEGPDANGMRWLVVHVCGGDVGHDEFINIDAAVALPLYQLLYKVLVRDGGGVRGS